MQWNGVAPIKHSHFLPYEASSKQMVPAPIKQLAPTNRASCNPVNLKLSLTEMS